MNSNGFKSKIIGFLQTVFQEEIIRPKTSPNPPALPSPIRAARALENNEPQNYHSRNTLFLKQGKLLENFEDNYNFSDSIQRYYPTYQTLTNPELRGYLSWRTQLRKGKLYKTSLSFAFLYIYELLNQIGVSNPLDGYHKLKTFQAAYSKLDRKILSYLKNWLVDYVVYYNLDQKLFASECQDCFEESIAVLEQIQKHDTATVINAVKQLAPKWLKRSKFYASHQNEMDLVTVQVLRRMSDHYAEKCKSPMVDQYFGACNQEQIYLFASAVFCDPLQRWDYQYIVNDQRIYSCKNGIWSVQKHSDLLESHRKLEKLVKTIDAVMRQEFNDCNPIKTDLNTKWIIQSIREETQKLLRDQKAAEQKKITIDYSQLTKIRQNAALTQEKLIVEEEMDPLEETEAEPQPEQDDSAPLTPSDSPEEDSASLLSPPEYRLLHDLLYGGDQSWVEKEGYLISVLVDGINEKLYDTFLDVVLDDTPQPVEDYINDLKEMVCP